MPTDPTWGGNERAEVLAKLRRFFTDPRHYGATYQDQVHAFVEEVDPPIALEGALDALAEMEEALRRHGVHEGDCDAWTESGAEKADDSKCNCGLRAVLAKYRPPKGTT